MFCHGLLHLRNLKSALALAQSCFSTVKRTKGRILWCYTPFVQFQIRVDTCTNRICSSKHLKRRVLCWNIAFAQLKVKVDSWTKWIFDCKTLKKRCFALGERGVFFFFFLPLKKKRARATRFWPFWWYFLGHLLAFRARNLSICRLFSRPLFFTGTSLIFFLGRFENFVSRALISMVLAQVAQEQKIKNSLFLKI